MAVSYNQLAARRLDRISALSDGLFAIAMTLIVLEIRLPEAATIRTEQDLWGALLNLAPRLVTYLLSFLTLGIFWSGQQTQLNYFANADRHLSWIYLGFLAGIALMPFSTSVLAEFITFRIALLVYWFNIFPLGALLYFAWIYASRAGLVRPDAGANVSAALKRRILAAQALYALGAFLCVINTYWSIGFIVVVQLNFAVAPRVPWLSRV